jgi:Mrp family chromosome partitioning ATPase
VEEYLVDSIKQAIELARAGDGSFLGLPDDQVTADRSPGHRAKEVRLSAQHLEANRIVAFGGTVENGRYYDMLRTQVLQEMDKKSWQYLALTSPTAGCGKTLTACNLAMSIARLPERSVLLVDLDLRKPTIAKYLGLGSTVGILDVLEGGHSLSSVVVEARLGPNSFLVVPGTVSTPKSSEWMASQTMGAVLQTIKREFRSSIVIFDLPPLLLGDEVISILPRMDATMLIASIGTTSVADIRECQKHLQSTSVVRVIANKVTDKVGSYYGY